MARASVMGLLLQMEVWEEAMSTSQAGVDRAPGVVSTAGPFCITLVILRSAPPSREKLHVGLLCYTLQATVLLMTKEQFNVRLDPDLKAKLDAWLKDLNRGRRMPLKRSELVRGVLDWAADHRPDFERMEPPSATVSQKSPESLP